MRENLTSSSYGEGLEAGEEVQQRASPLPDSCFEALKQSLELKTFVGTSENAVQTQIWTAPIAMLLMKYLQLGSTFWVELVSKWCTALLPKGALIGLLSSG